MANDKTYDRHINIWINGKEVKNDVASIKKEMYQLINAQSRMTIGSKEYVAAGEEIKRLKGILGDHNASLRQTQSVWGKVKDTAAGTMLKLTALTGVIFGAVKTIKSLASTTEGLGDRISFFMGGAKEMFWELQRSVATLNFSNLINGLTEAWKRGKLLNEELDRLADERAYSDYIISSLSRESRKLEEVTKNTQLEITVRADAARKREEIENKIYNRTVQLASKNFEIEKQAWTGRNKIAAEEAIKLYETVENLSKDVSDRLAKAFEYQTGLFGKQRGAEMIKSGQAMAGQLQGIPKEVISSYADYFLLLEHGEADVLPKLFNAFKTYEEAVETAQERMNTFVRESSRIFVKEEKTVNVTGDTSNLETAVAGAMMSAEYNPSDFAMVGAEIDAYLEHEKQVNDQRQKDYEETQDAIYQSIVDSADEALEEMKRNREEEMRMLQDNLSAYSQYGEQIGGILGQAMTNTTLTARDVAKELLRIAFQELKRRADLYIAEMSIKNIALYGILAGGIKSARQALFIRGALAAAEQLSLGMFSSGGYTGAGGKYDPRGIVHAGEWVANKDMVSSPMTGPIIRALEGYRQNAAPGFADGGYTSSAGSQASDIYGPEDIFSKLNRNIEATNRNVMLNNELLSKLDKDGVKNKWTYKDIDNLREGITRIEDIED